MLVEQWPRSSPHGMEYVAKDGCALVLLLRGGASVCAPHEARPSSVSCLYFAVLNRAFSQVLYTLGTPRRKASETDTSEVDSMAESRAEEKL